MKKSFKCIFLGMALTAGLSGPVKAADVNFGNATVQLVEARSGAWGTPILIITLVDSSGNRIMRLCDTAPDKAAIAIPFSDPAANAIMSVALTAKAAGKTVTGWGLDATQGSWCGIGNFALYP